MKTIKKSLVAMVLLSTLIANANHNRLNSLSDNVKTTTLKLNDVKSGQKLVLKDIDKTVLYSELILNSGTYSRNFDLTSLPKGMYSFELDQGFAYRIIPFEVIDSTVVFLNKKEHLVFKPIIKTEGNLLKVGQSPLSNSSIKVHIYYDSGNDEIIYTDEISQVKKGFRTYKLLKNKKGNYRVVCELEGRVFTKHFKF